MLGCLVEKHLTTPQQYPLTDSSLIAACNQTTSRDPVVAYDVATVRLAVRSLRERDLLRTVHRTGERSDKHQHQLDTALGLSAPQVALLAVLLLRGPQTLAELRARTERMHPFDPVEQIESELVLMAQRDEPLVARLERQPGRKEARYAQLLVVRDAAPSETERPDPRDAAADAAAAAGESMPPPSASWTGSTPAAVHVAGGPAGGPPVLPHDSAGDALTGLIAEVAQLRAEVADLRARLDAQA